MLGAAKIAEQMHWSVSKRRNRLFQRRKRVERRQFGGCQIVAKSKIVFMLILWRSIPSKALTGELLWSYQDQDCVSWLTSSPVTWEQLLVCRQLDPASFLFPHVHHHRDDLYCVIAAGDDYNHTQ